MNKAIQTIINQYEVKGNFTHAAITDDQISEAQSVLSVDLPHQYIEFLQIYGHGGIGGVEIIGIGKNGHLLFVDETLKYRKYGLPDNLIVVENCDEWLYCINSDTGRIETWSNQTRTEAYPDFDTYLQDRFTEEAENL